MRGGYGKRGGFNHGGSNFSNNPKPGDWFCSTCDFMNFAKNTECRNCNQSKSLSSENIESDWVCFYCDFLNFRRNRFNCKNCFKDKKAKEASLNGNSTDWFCGHCGFYNFSKNINCKSCSKAKFVIDPVKVASIKKEKQIEIGHKKEEIKIKPVLFEEKQLLCPNIKLHFVVDSSLTMNGDKLNQIKEGIKILYNGLLEENDYISLSNFNKNFSLIFNETLKNDTKFELMSFTPDNERCLYDAIAGSIQIEKSSKNKIESREIIVLTDGKDSISKTTENELFELFRNFSLYLPNSNLNIIGIGKEVNRITFLQLCDKSPNCHFNDVSEREIKQSFLNIANRVFSVKVAIYEKLNKSTEVLRLSYNNAVKLLSN